MGLRARQRQIRQSNIIASAMTLISRNGYDETSVADIAEIAEVSPRTVYNNFGRKEQLLLAMAEAYAERWRHRAQAHIKNAPEDSARRLVASCAPKSRRASSTRTRRSGARSSSQLCLCPRIARAPSFRSFAYCPSTFSTYSRNEAASHRAWIAGKADACSTASRAICFTTWCRWTRARPKFRAARSSPAGSGKSSGGYMPTRCPRLVEALSIESRACRGRQPSAGANGHTKLPDHGRGI